MAEEGKKISFSFSKSIKKTVLKNAPPSEQKKIDYIECVDEKSIKIVGGEEKKDEPLIIPMLGSKTWHDRIINKVDADIFEPKVIQSKIKDEPLQSIQIKEEKIDGIANSNISNEIVQPMEVTEIKKEPDLDPLMLEKQAALEIIADLKSDDVKVKNQNVFTVPIKDNDDLKGKEESSLEDYENIPIDVFGIAMLRGMGWQPGKGIGKNEKIVPPSIPELRPKGMGLGADKLVAQHLKGKSSKEDEQLKLLKGSCAKIVAGKYSGSYGKVEGFDEDAARLILKLALGNEVISVNEFWVQPVTSTEYSQNSKVLNVKKYEEYKNNDANNKEKLKHDISKNIEDSNNEVHKNKHSEKKKSKKKKYQSSDGNSNIDRKSRKKGDSFDSNDEQKQKKSKKSKKHKSRDNSSERTNRKNKKKDKKYEKTKHKKSDHLASPESSRNKSRRRFRSRSNSPRNHRSRSRSYSPRNRRRNRIRSRSPRR